MQCKELEAVLEQEDLSPLPIEAREHLANCAACQDFLADLSAIVVAAKRIPAAINPPDRVWVSLRAQLETEGVIRDIQPAEISIVAPWWQVFSQVFRPRALATVGAGLFLILGSVYLVQRGGPSTTLKNPARPQVTKSASEVIAAPVKEDAVAPATKSAPPVHSAGIAVPRAVKPSKANDGLRPSPSENAYAAVLSGMEDALPRRELARNAAVDASLRENLATLNEFIAECEARLKKNPQDRLTREYLNMAYQQKAELLTAMMDNGRSEQ
jgi:hypothetical protein